MTFLENYVMNFDETWQAHITVSAHCAATTQMHKVKGQHHMKLKTDMEYVQYVSSTFVT